MRSVLSDVMGFLETAGTVMFFKFRERAASDVLGHVNDTLELFSLSHCTAGVPHTDAVGHYALNRALIKGHQQSLCDIFFLSTLRKYSLCWAFFSRFSCSRSGCF
ncbi:hypothetical protein ILYODFUR_005899 [Ilyodon furcidens]|uniref:Uncharacterized protein n=1 Tax=Ilyodon furcidens TaxID=33524 RepID=A0ABV0UEL6_9TELE